MPSVAVALLTENTARLALLSNQVEHTCLARLVFANLGFPTVTADPVVRQIQNHETEVVLVDMDAANPERAIHAIEAISATADDIATFAIAESPNPAHIVSAMRAGAREFLYRAAGPHALQEALNRFVFARCRTRGRAHRARLFTVINAKGGAGATTLAVNLAIALQKNHGPTVLVDFACIGNVALHLDVSPASGLAEALQNLHRMDKAFLECLMTTTKEGLQLLSGFQRPYEEAVSTAELVQLFDLLVGLYRYIVVDCSSRMDNATQCLAGLSNAVLMVAQADVVTLWSAERIRTFLLERTNRQRVHLGLVLNRYKKIQGVTEKDVENFTGCHILWKLPNSCSLIAPDIERGESTAAQDGNELGRSFHSFAASLAADTGFDTPHESACPAVLFR